MYAAALWQNLLVVERIETWLARLEDQAAISPPQALPEVADLSIGYDQVALVLEALIALGILRRTARGPLVLDRAQLLATAAYREGVQHGLAHARTLGPRDLPPRLVAALPAGLPPAMMAGWQQRADDLRAALIALITAAQQDICLAAPFWDDATVAEWEGLLARRLEAGIRVAVLGRRPPSSVADTRSPRGFARLAQALAPFPAFAAYVWDTPQADDRFGAQTFHFKCITIDRGKAAYLGTANFTSASLRSRMELGLIVAGPLAASLRSILADILTIAAPWPEATRTT